MSDIRCQYVAVDVLATSPSASATSSNFSAVDPLSTFMIPSGSRHDTAGIGRIGGAQLSLWQYWLLSADLSDDGASIVFRRDNGTANESARAAVQLIEYVGPANGANEFIRRHKETLTLGPAVASVDSTTLTGFTDINRCVPVAFGRTDAANNQIGEGCLKVEIVDVAGDKKVRLSRDDSGNSVTAIVYVVEFTGSNWTIQKVSRSITAPDVNFDDTITSVDPTQTLIWNTYQTNGFYDSATIFAWLADSTTLRQRAEQISTTSSVTYLLTNSQLAVQKLGTPDGTRPWTAGSSPQTINTTCTAVAGLTTSSVILQAGSNIAANLSNPGGMWGVRLTTTTNVEAYRGDSIGDTDFVIHVADFSALVPGPAVSTVTDVIQGGTFTITGTNFDTPTVTIGGVSQTVGSSTDTTIDCTFVRGTMKYGVQTLVVTTAEGTSSVPVNVTPVAGGGYVDLIQLTSTAQRFTASADVVVGDQVAWTEPLAVVLSDGSFFAASSVSSFAIEVNDGTGWGTTGTQTRADPIVAPVILGTIPNFTFGVLDAVQFNVAQYATGWDTATLSSPLPSGLTNDQGVISGMVSLPGTTTLPVVFTFVVTYTNVAGSTQSNLFSLTFTSSLVVVPIITGLNVSDATVALATVGLVLGNQTTANSDSVSVGLIISQVPGGGSTVASGTEVDISVSLGPIPFPGPTLKTRRKTNLRKFLLG